MAQWEQLPDPERVEAITLEVGDSIAGCLDKIREVGTAHGPSKLYELRGVELRRHGGEARKEDRLALWGKWYLDDVITPKLIGANVAIRRVEDHGNSQWFSVLVLKPERKPTPPPPPVEGEDDNYPPFA